MSIKSDAENNEAGAFGGRRHLLLNRESTQTLFSCVSFFSDTCPPPNPAQPIHTYKPSGVPIKKTPFSWKKTPSDPSTNLLSDAKVG